MNKKAATLQNLQDFLTFFFLLHHYFDHRCLLSEKEDIHCGEMISCMLQFRCFVFVLLHNT